MLRAADWFMQYALRSDCRETECIHRQEIDREDSTPPSKKLQKARSMPHDHGHAQVDAKSGDRRVSIAIWANALLTVAQVVGGVLAGSLALIADALHNFSDMGSLC